MTTASDITDAVARPDNRTIAIYFSVLAAMFMAALDMNIVVTALPTIAGELSGYELFGWVGAAYLLATAAVAPFYGKLGDMFGRKPVLMTAIVFFLAGSLASGLAWSMQALIAARVLQGFGGGGLIVSVFAVIGDIFTPRQRPKYQGYSTAVFTLASILGPVAGGYITSYIGWRWVFLVNLPIGMVVLALLFTVMPGRTGGKRHKVDYAGGLLLAVATTAIVYWSDHMLDPAGATAMTFALPVLALIGLAIFVMVERRAAEPVVPLHLLGNRTIALSLVISVLAGASTLGLFFYFALYLQMLTGLSPAMVGVLFMPSSLATMASSMWSGSVIGRTGRYKMFPIASMALGAATMLAFLSVNAHTPYWAMSALMCLFGVSLGFSVQVMLVAVQNAAPRADIGAATGLVSLARTIGASLGLALNGSVIHTALTRQQASLPAGIATQLPGGGLPALSPHDLLGLTAGVRDTVLGFYNAGFHTVFGFVAAMFGLSLIVALILPNVQIQPRGH